ncbi:MAG: sigma 54-interacting transcriptional regulator [Pirellulaceae bacterium]|nr:sigma 54-interacting transcriptional regulator [Pirellulaceae bacterium]
MHRFHEILLSVWRETCRHIDLGEAVRTVAPLLAERLPLEAVIVRRLDPQHQSLETIVVAAAEGSHPPQIGRTPCSEARFKRLASWVKAGKLLHSQRSKRSGELAMIVPEEVEGEVLACPLPSPEGPGGVLAFIAAHTKSFKDEHLKMAEELLEPFSVALENDRRLHELATLRAVAEADKSSLLARLGKREMSEVIVGSEAGLRPVMERVELVSQSDVPVLILGETGTGKEVVSRAIHNKSARHDGPFIRVNCGAIPTELIDSQLFGHERGSFTGALETRQGWFERADGGTLFLDEIGELPLPAQVRLLRVLQDGFIERVGGQQPIHVDVRMIAATHRDLAAMVRDRSFREDLWYRISVFPIMLPPLRDRLDDIPALARHFADRAANRFGLSLVEPSAADLQVLRKYAWPGNIRELGAVIDRAAILGDGKSLEVAKSLGFGITPPQPAPPPPTYYEVTTDDLRQPSPGIASLDTAMQQHIEKALSATRGKIEGRGGAAEVLGINPHTLRARMRKLGISWSKFRPNTLPDVVF